MPQKPLPPLLTRKQLLEAVLDAMTTKGPNETDWETGWLRTSTADHDWLVEIIKDHNKK
jgi:hypothetical protein